MSLLNSLRGGFQMYSICSWCLRISRLSVFLLLILISQFAYAQDPEYAFDKDPETTWEPDQEDPVFIAFGEDKVFDRILMLDAAHHVMVPSSFEVTFYKNGEAIQGGHFYYEEGDYDLGDITYQQGLSFGEELVADGMEIVVYESFAGAFFISELILYKSLESPILSEVSASSSEIEISWGVVSGASSYSVYLNGAYKGSTSTTTYTFTELNSATSYNIEVRALGDILLSPALDDFVDTFDWTNESTPGNQTVTTSRGLESAFDKDPETTWEPDQEDPVFIAFGEDKVFDRILMLDAAHHVMVPSSFEVTFYKNGEAIQGGHFYYEEGDYDLGDITYQQGLSFGEELVADGMEIVVYESFAGAFFISELILYKSLESPILSEVSASSSEIEISWGAVSGASSYSVYLNGAYRGSTSGTTYTFTGISRGSSHKIEVKAHDNISLSPALDEFVDIFDWTYESELESLYVTISYECDPALEPNGICVEIDEEISHNPIHNGNISAIRWRSVNDEDEQLYTYGYDGLNRLINAKYAAKGSGSYDSKQGHYSLPNISYDLNGNITTLTRQGKNAKDLIDEIDNLTYNYGSGGNQLKAVVDTEVQDGFKDGNKGIDD